MTFRSTTCARLLALLLPLGAVEARAQAARPAGVVAVQDSLPGGRRVRDFPVVFAGALGGGGIGMLAGAAIGAALVPSTHSDTDEWISPRLAAALAGAAFGYAIGAGAGAHFAASSRPRPNALATVGISVLSAVVVGVAGGGLGSAGVNEGLAYATAVAVPVAHLAVTAQFARWRAQRR